MSVAGSVTHQPEALARVLRYSSLAFRVSVEELTRERAAFIDLEQILRLLVLAIPIAWAAWTVTHEEVFREFKDYCTSRSRACQRLAERKFFYLFTCEYCFSHWCTLLCLAIFQFKLIYDDWRGYVVSFTALVWVANLYMNLYQRTRVDIRKQRAIADQAESQVRRRATG